MQSVLKAGLALALLSLAGTAAAVESGSPFVRAELARSVVDVDVEGLGSDTDDDRAFLIGGGYYFTPNIAVEAFHTSLYDYSEEGYSADLKGVGVGVVLRKNFGADANGFYVAGRLGAFRARGSAEAEDVGSIDGNSTKPYAGIALGYDFNEHVGAGVAYSMYRSDFDDLTVKARTLGLQVEVRF